MNERDIINKINCLRTVVQSKNELRLNKSDILKIKEKILILIELL